MDKKAKWIWYDGDFELYHHALLSCRRQELGFDYPCMWRVARPELNVTFYRCFEARENGVMHVYSHSKGFVASAGKRYPVNTDIPYEKGKLEIEIQLYDLTGFPSVFIDSGEIRTDESWVAHCGDKKRKKVGFEPCFCSPDDDPKIFPFSYETVTPINETPVNGGKLFDFGKEYFGKITFDEIKAGDEITLIYGESQAEALDFENAIVREKLSSADELSRPARAFRYIFLKSRENNDVGFTAEYEYLPIKDRASFSCDREIIKKIWDICSYTFHLNSREFYLDGIKRDRWVWSGDAYQSFIINRYLYSEPQITKRTIRALLGKPEYTCHINTINDYSAYLIMAVWEHYFASGDDEFVLSVWDKVKSLCQFITSRLDENGYVTAREGDWIFIDWGDVDKKGTLCAEQILLMKVYESMARLAEVCHEDGGEYAEKAKLLAKKINNDFFDAEKGYYIDCFDNENRHVSRQTNVFAVLFGLADEKTAGDIMKNVLNNDAVSPITTPYFKLYELMARCRCGDIVSMQKYIEEYWGAMLELGATSVWEQFDPTEKGEAHYGMYGKRFDKSLCHAWGSGPLYLLGRYCAGVEITDIAAKKYTVTPNRGIYKHFEAEVPINDKTVKVRYDGDTVTVFSDAAGGTLVFGGREYEIIPGKELTAEEV